MAKDAEQQTRVSPILEGTGPVLLPAFEVGVRSASLGIGTQPMSSAGYMATGFNPELLTPRSSASSGVLRILILVFAVLAALLGYFLYDEVSHGHDPIESLGRLIGLSEQTDNVSIEQEIARNQALAKARLQKALAKPAEMVSPPNPYWRLPNSVTRTAQPSGRSMSPEDEQIWRSGLSSAYVYQHFKTVNQIRAGKIRGGEKLLFEALSEKKFWTRMSALVGLAEFGIQPDVDVVDRAIGDTRPSLVANYMLRFRKVSTAPQRFVMRQALRVVDAKARLNILRGLARVEGPDAWPLFGGRCL